MTVDAYEEQKSSSGSLSMWVFIFSALYLFISDHGLASLFTLKAIIFFVVGMFLSAIIIGIPAYFLQRGVAKFWMMMTSDGVSKQARSGIKITGFILLVVQVITTFFVTKVVYLWLI